MTSITSQSFWHALEYTDVIFPSPLIMRTVTRASVDKLATRDVAIDACLWLNTNYEVFSSLDTWAKEFADYVIAWLSKQIYESNIAK